MGGGSSQVTPHKFATPLEAILDRAGEKLEVRYSLGTSLYKSLPPIRVDLLEWEGKPGMQIDIFDNLDLSADPVVSHHIENANITWSDRFIAPADPSQFSARISAHFTPAESGIHTFVLGGNGRCKLILAGQELIDHWQEAPSTTPWEVSDEGVEIQLEAGQTYPLEVHFAFEGEFPWRVLRICCLPPLPADPVGDALRSASQADLVLLFAGTTSEWESEGFDRPDMELPEGQNELIEQVVKVNPNTVVVLNTGAPVRMPWIEKVPAMIQAWFGGQEMGEAIADVLFGVVNPSGKLPTTFPVRLQDNPAYINYPGENGRVYYGEGIFVGYRYYEYKDLEPLFPFGYGLSYTDFEYGNVVLSSQRMKLGETISVSVNVTNVGGMAGKEVVQLYIRDSQSRLVRPLKELKGFAKIELQPGETQLVNFEIEEDALKYYDDELRKWIAEPGIFELFIGGSSHDLQVAAKFEYLATPG
jgi:beta-glucosidase